MEYLSVGGKYRIRVLSWYWLKGISNPAVALRDFLELSAIKGSGQLYSRGKKPFWPNLTSPTKKLLISSTSMALLCILSCLPASSGPRPPCSRRFRLGPRFVVKSCFQSPQLKAFASAAFLYFCILKTRFDNKSSVGRANSKCYATTANNNKEQKLSTFGLSFAPHL